MNTTTIRILTAADAPELLRRKAARMSEAEAAVRPILEDVRQRGDAALLEYCRRFDAFEGDTIALPRERLKAAKQALPPEFRRAVKVASANIRAFAQLQMPETKTVEVMRGVKVGQVVRPLDTVACYIPAGRYPLPSTLMMTAIPAQVAGVETICVCTPRPVNEILGTAAMLKLRRVFQMGGAHAVAAFAFGTETVPKADRIVGPGSIYVAAAKRLLAGEVGIDFVAGPTEILIAADEGEPSWIAADMLAQAEHDTDASAVLLTRSRPLAEAVAAEVTRQLEGLPTAEVARVALERNGAIIVTQSRDETVEWINRFAPEHLSLHDPALMKDVRHAGGVFLGASSPEAAGDYAAGPSHVLPTSGAARLRGGLSVLDFVKVIATQKLTAEGLQRLAPAITTLARAEGLEAHARSVEVRLQRTREAKA